MKRIRLVLQSCFLCLFLLGLPVMPVMAADTIYNSPYVSFSPDGKAWTTNAGDRNYSFYERGTVVETGIESSLRPLEKGEHYYAELRDGAIPIGYWDVVHKWGTCIHDEYPEEGWHEINFNTKCCLNYYYSGWLPHCADCGEKIVSSLFYMGKNAVETVDYLEVGNGMDYYYLCPHCNNLEQGVSFGKHRCRAISWNRYAVKYNANTGENSYGGYMADSFHMYNNATEYEGKTITPITHLTKNGYTRIGYEFVAWNTKPDGTGISYADGEEIFNLTDKNVNTDGEKGIVVLYAMWRPSSGTLKINPNGGSYRGIREITAITQDYGSVYTPEITEIKPPKGYTVSFETNGGDAIGSIIGTQHFTEWNMVPPFNGKLMSGKYYFFAPDGNIDTIMAKYACDAVILPAATKSNMSFGGWYYDEDLENPAGSPGDSIIPDRDLTLYAGWVDLKLVSEDNYTVNSGKGAVNLSWSRKDINKKSYMIYQSRDGKNWKKINDVNDIANNRTVEKTFTFTGTERKYIIPYTGLYVLTAEGAQGANYGNYEGGSGGRVSAKIWLQKGEIITYTIGGQNGYNGGGTADMFANGGGCTVISTDKKGTIMIAGGGGGATELGTGGAGGSSTSVLNTGINGENGASGGGGGYLGGSAGEVIRHIHGKECKHTHTTGCYIYHTHSEYGGKCYKYDHSEEITSSVRCNDCGYWGGHWMWNTGVCDGCGGGNISPTWNDIYVLACGKTSSTIEGYKCGRDERYICGMKQNQILSSKPAYGGTNYVNTTYSKSYSESMGTGKGDGAFSLKSETIGYVESQELKGVSAPDMAAPEKISLGTVQKTGVGNTRVKVSWAAPEDNGTPYYHVAESYMSGSDTLLCRSNITKNNLVSGIKGYYCLLDGNSTSTADEGTGVFLLGKENGGSLVTELSEELLYLHVAAVDVAGNVGETEHIRLGTIQEADGIQWTLYTEQLSIEEGDNVYPAGTDKTYFVRSDGVTPFVLHYGGYMDGPAALHYQPNHMIYESVTEDGVAQNVFTVVSNPLKEGEIDIDEGQVGYATVDNPLLVRGSYAVITRSRKNSRLSAVQEFLLPAEASGKEIEITPIVGADYMGEVLYSDREADEKNGVILIADGEAPLIDGMDVLENMERINRGEGSITLQLTAKDELSGVKDFYLEIYNSDNVIKEVFRPDGNGVIRVNITKDKPVFSGDFTVSAYAIDNVGNERTEKYSTTEFALEARVKRILSPHAPVFQCGESGLLTVTTWGYADYIEITFPKEMTDLNPELNQTFFYKDTPQYKQQDTVQFMVPLYTPADAEYFITVRAYKGDKMLEEFPGISTVSVQGSILDDIRTRLR